MRLYLDSHRVVDQRRVLADLHCSLARPNGYREVRMLKAIVKVSLAYLYTITFLYLCLIWPVLQGLEVQREILLYLMAPSSWLVEPLYGTWMTSLNLDLSQQLGLVFALSVVHNIPLLAVVTAMSYLRRNRSVPPSAFRHETT